MREMTIIGSLFFAFFSGRLMFDLAGVKIQETNHIHIQSFSKQLTFGLLNFPKLSVHMFCLAAWQKTAKMSEQIAEQTACRTK
jgi:hypothetical protein